MTTITAAAIIDAALLSLRITVELTAEEKAAAYDRLVEVRRG